MSHREALVRPLLLALTLAAGFGAAWDAVVLWGLNIVHNWRSSQHVSEELYIQSDGTPILQTYSPRNYQLREARTLDGVPVTQVNPVNAAALAPPWQAPFDGLTWYQRLHGIGGSEIHPELWYFLHDGRQDGRGYFVGYDPESAGVIGYLGVHGFQNELPAPDAQFPVAGQLIDVFPGQQGALDAYTYGGGFEPDVNRGYSGDATRPDVKTLLISNDTVLEINFTKRGVQPWFQGKDLVSIGPVAVLAPADPTKPLMKTDPGRVVRTTQSLLFFTSAGLQRRSISLPAELRFQPLQVFELHDGMVLIRVNQRTKENPGDMLYWLSEDASAIKVREVPLRNARILTPAQTWNWLGAGLPAPGPLAVGAAVVAPLQKVRDGQEPSYGSALAETLRHAWPALLITTLISAGLAVGCWRWHRRHGGSYALVWSGFVFLLGVPGLVGYVYHRRWPVTATCPACAKSTPRDRQSCMHCHAAFPAPMPRGTEIFG